MGCICCEGCICSRTLCWLLRAGATLDTLHQGCSKGVWASATCCIAPQEAAKVGHDTCGCLQEMAACREPRCSSLACSGPEVSGCSLEGCCALGKCSSSVAVGLWNKQVACCCAQQSMQNVEGQHKLLLDGSTWRAVHVPVCRPPLIVCSRSAHTSGWPSRCTETPLHTHRASAVDRSCCGPQLLLTRQHSSCHTTFS